MARSRNIKPAIPENEVLAELGPMHQFCFAVLPCHADREGCLEDRPRRLKAKIFPYYEADVDQILQDLADCEEQFIVRYAVGGKRYIQITNFFKHQSPHHKEVESTIPPCPVLDPSINQVQVNHDNPGPQAPVKGIRNQVKEISNKESGNKNQESRTGTKPFAKFWDAVHHKAGKRAAETAYDLAVKRIDIEQRDVEPHRFLLERMQAFAKSPASRPTEHRPIHPATWLDQGRYDDDTATWQETQQSRGGTPTHNGQADPRGNLAVRDQLLKELEK